jgi:hypothetical protein
MPRYVFDLKSVDHSLVDKAGSDRRNDGARQSESSRHRRFTRPTGNRSEAPHFCSKCGQGRDFLGGGIFQTYRAIKMLTLALEPMKPTVCLGGFHRVGQINHYLMDVVADRTFECPDVKAGKAVRDSRQHCL